MSGTWQPYCGQAPLPGELIGRWNFDPVLLIAMAAVMALQAVSLQRSGELARKRWLFAATWLTFAALFISPLCALSSALFSVRVAHHVVLIAVAAPMAVLLLPQRWRMPRFTAGSLGLIFTLHAGIVWFWHAPGAYTWALSSDLAFWFMQIGLLVSAMAVWLAILSPAIPLGFALGMLLGTVIQMGLLGALITFARGPLYVPHFATTDAFGLSALADQQLAGLIMWVPANIPYLIAALVLFSLYLTRADIAPRRS